MTNIAIPDAPPIPTELETTASTDVRPGNPGLIALPLIVAGGFGLGVTNTGILDVAAAAVPVLLSATSIGLLVATIWAAALGQNVNATVYGTFFGFYGSYAVLSLGLTHDWFGIAATMRQTPWRCGLPAGSSRSDY